MIACRGIFVWSTLLLLAAGAGAQVAPVPRADSASEVLPRVFLDCQADGCDTDFLRTELTWMNFVRDRNVALVHILATDRSTASGGREITIAFIGQDSLSAVVDTIVQFAPLGATDDEQRRLVARTIAQGMLRFVRASPLATQLSVVYRPRPGGLIVTDTRGARDRWHLWVFRIGASGFLNGDENYKSSSLSGSVRATRTTERWKASLSVSGDYRENSYALSDSETLVTYRHGYNVDGLVARSLSTHWSLGVQANAASSVVSNLDLGLRVGPALEYDVFPYSESTRRQVIVRYGVGVKALNYSDVTIYDRTSETLVDHRLVVAAEMTQPWGELGADVSVNQYLHDMTKRSFNVGVGVSWRVLTGLNLNLDAGYSQIRDQINLKRAELTDEDVLLQLRQLRTGYSYYGSVGLSYTFGSIFQNVVNPRMSRNNGNFFF